MDHACINFIENIGFFSNEPDLIDLDMSPLKQPSRILATHYSLRVGTLGFCMESVLRNHVAKCFDAGSLSAGVVLR
jgi:hypothetical protein